MRTVCVIQARMGSRRLPGKVLADLDGRPLLKFMLHRLEHLQVDDLVVATTTDPRDQPVVDLVSAMGIVVTRGSESDVLERFVDAVSPLAPCALVRLTADCPLVDPTIVRRMLDRHFDAGADYTCNVLPRTFPKGLDVEVVDYSALLQAHERAVDPAEREHVTPYLYRHPEQFRLANVRSGATLDAHRWAVDTADDLERVRTLVAAVGGGPDVRWEDVLAVSTPLPRDPGITLRPATSDDAPFLLALRNDEDDVRTSASGREVELAEHARWMAARLDDPGTQLWIVEDGAAQVGQVRVDVDDAIGTVSIALTRSNRGRGVGRAALSALVNATITSEQVVALRAEVVQGNEPSLALFRSAGFHESGARSSGLVELRWVPAS